MVELTEKGEEYEAYADVEQDLIEAGYSKDEIYTAINHVAEMNSMDLGEEVYLFLEGMDYGKKLRETKESGGAENDKS